jgi:hypothetical protein
MTQLTLRLASTHDHWFDEPATSEHALAAARLGWRQFTKHYPGVIEALEWVSCAALAVGMLGATLIANA